jgi:hypothetical protein
MRLCIKVSGKEKMKYVSLEKENQLTVLKINRPERLAVVLAEHRTTEKSRLTSRKSGMIFTHATAWRGPRRKNKGSSGICRNSTWKRENIGESSPQTRHPQSGKLSNKSRRNVLWLWMGIKTQLGEGNF